MKPHILVVEDNAFSRELLCDWLELQGFTVASATSLSEALAAVMRCEPAAVLLDVQLGGEDGLSLAAWLRLDKARHHIPVIAVTAHAMFSEQDRILRAGCNACISKPVDFPLLLEKLNRWLTVAGVMNRNARTEGPIADQAFRGNEEIPCPTKC
jgi:two-component system cell cycle response regulator DivK